MQRDGFHKMLKLYERRGFNKLRTTFARLRSERAKTSLTPCLLDDVTLRVIM